MKRKRFCFFNVLLLITFLSVTHDIYGQFQDSILQNKNAIDSILASEQLGKLEGKPATFYSLGHEVRAKALQQLVFKCDRFYENHFPKKKFEESIYVLDKSDWEKPPFGVPYGLPEYFPENKLEIIAAEKNALALLSNKPDDSVKSDKIVSGYDYVALHELGHYFFVTLYNMRTQKWFDEFLASYFLISYVNQNNIRFDMKTFFMPEGNQPHKSLNDFNTLYESVGPANYDWYQREFIQLGLQLYPQLKLELIKKVLENYSPGGKQLDGMALLKNLAPDTMNKWLKGIH